MGSSIIRSSKLMVISGLIISLLLLAGCAEYKTDAQKNEIANPASVYCTDHGGSLKMIDEVQGQRGICTLSDGTECDEWDFMAGKCPGNEHICTAEEKAATMCTMEYMPVCGDDGVTYGNRCSACASNKIDSYVKGECTDSCGECPMLSPPGPDFCKGGDITPGPKDACGCASAPRCSLDSPVACTMDAKICPDGSAVGRVAPDCEFEACPATAAGKKVPHYCGEETPRTDACTKEYRAVCGYFSQDIKCIRAPCAIDASNPCVACSNPDVEYWVEGECNMP